MVDYDSMIRHMREEFLVESIDHELSGSCFGESEGLSFKVVCCGDIVKIYIFKDGNELYNVVTYDITNYYYQEHSYETTYEDVVNRIVSDFKHYIKYQFISQGRQDSILIPLECPKCGASIGRDKKKCDFCGTEFK